MTLTLVNCYSYITVGRQLTCDKIVLKQFIDHFGNHGVDILCPSLIVMAPALAVEPSAMNMIPVPKELTPRSVQCLLL